MIFDHTKYPGTRRRCRQIALLCLIICGRLAAHAADKDPTRVPLENDLGRVVELSPFEVRAKSAAFEHWIKIASPHYIVYTDADESEVTVLLRQMEMLRTAVETTFHRATLNTAPMVIVLPASHSDWREVERSGHMPSGASISAREHVTNILVIQYDWQNTNLSLLWSTLSFGETDSLNIDGEYWFKVGVAHFFETATFTSDSISIGQVGPFFSYMKNPAWLPWDEFATFSKNSDESARDSDVHRRWEGQAAVFTHFILSKKDPVWTGRLLAWNAYLRAGNIATDDSFHAYFQTDWKSVQTSIEHVINGGRYEVTTIKFPPAARDYPVTIYKLPAQEMRELFVLGEILNQDTRESNASLDALIARGIKTDNLRELLANDCIARKRNDTALLELRKLIDAGSTNPEVYNNAARIRFRAAIPTLSLDARLGDEAAEIQAWCERALTLEPHHQQASNTLAWATALAPTVEAGGVQRIIKICHTLDGFAATDEALAALAVARWRTNGIKQVLSICGALASSPYSDKQSCTIAADLMHRIATHTRSAAIPVGQP